MANGTGTTNSSGGGTALPGSVEGLLTVSAREAQAAHRGTDAILTMLGRGGGEPDPDDPVAAIAELLMQAEERDEETADAIAALHGTLDVVGDSVAKIRDEQTQATAREQLLRQEVQALRQRLEQFLSMVRIPSAVGSGGSGPR